MSTYNDFLIKANVGFVDLSDKFCTKLQQGLRDCLLENKIRILAMYIDTIPRSFTGGCLDEDQLKGITDHIQWLLGCYTLGDLNSSDIPQPVDPYPPTVTTTSTETSFAWNFTAGTIPIAVEFTDENGNPLSLGTSGSTWAMTYIAYTSTGMEVDPTITNRQADGFTVSFDEDNVHFEGSAHKIRS